ncbi:MAG: hypothetical protein HOV83_14610, partial [Catenulispora sp.]|nr:hypothetical protein [Catenulispora sp.]
QPRPQQTAAPRPAVPAAPAAPAAPAHAANGQAPRPRPQQPRDDFERRMGLNEQQDPGRSSDRNPVPPRRPNAAAQPRGTMGRRPATRPGRPSEY